MIATSVGKDAPSCLKSFILLHLRVVFTVFDEPEQSAAGTPNGQSYSLQGSAICPHSSEPSR